MTDRRIIIGKHGIKNFILLISFIKAEVDKDVHENILNRKYIDLFS